MEQKSFENMNSNNGNNEDFCTLSLFQKSRGKHRCFLTRYEAYLKFTTTNWFAARTE